MILFTAKEMVFMELLQLRYFCDAAQTQNFSETARKFFVPSSNISQTIHRLEKELGVALFERSANKITLNENGKIFYDAAKKSLGTLDDAKLFLSESKDKITGPIKLCICTNRRIVAHVIEKFKEMYPDVSFYINHGSPTDALSYDIIISDEHISNTKFSKKHLVSEDILLAIKKSNPLLKKGNIRIQDLKNQPFISMTHNSELYKLTVSICNDAGFQPNISIESDDPYYVRKYVELGLGIAFVPSLSWKGQFSDEIELLNIGKYKRKTYAFRQSEKQMKISVRIFLDMLIDECKAQ